MNNCIAVRYDVDILRIARHKTSRKPSVAHQYTALLFQIAVCRLWRQTPLIKADFHPVSYTVHCSLSAVREFACRYLDCACKSRNLEISHMCYTISRLGAQSQDWNANSECTMQSQDCANSQIAWNMYMYVRVVELKNQI